MKREADEGVTVDVEIGPVMTDVTTRELKSTQIAFEVSYSVFKVDSNGIKLNTGINNR